MSTFINLPTYGGWKWSDVSGLGQTFIDAFEFPALEKAAIDKKYREDKNLQQHIQKYAHLRKIVLSLYPKYVKIVTPQLENQGVIDVLNNPEKYPAKAFQTAFHIAVATVEVTLLKDNYQKIDENVLQNYLNVQFMMLEPLQKSFDQYRSEKVNDGNRGKAVASKIEIMKRFEQVRLDTTKIIKNGDKEKATLKKIYLISAPFINFPASGGWKWPELAESVPNFIETLEFPALDKLAQSKSFKRNENLQKYIGPYAHLRKIVLSLYPKYVKIVTPQLENQGVIDVLNNPEKYPAKAFQTALHIAVATVEVTLLKDNYKQLDENVLQNYLNVQFMMLNFLQKRFARAMDEKVNDGNRGKAITTKIGAMKLFEKLRLDTAKIIKNGDKKKDTLKKIYLTTSPLIKDLIK